MNAEPDKLVTKSSPTKIPSPLPVFTRSSSVRVRGEKACLSSIASEGDQYNNQRIPWKTFNKRREISSLNRVYFEDDLESIGSVASNFSVASANPSCEHANFAKNGTTYSGRSHKYIVHCSPGLNEEEEYLTPTQRANKSIRKLKSLLQLAREKLREKEQEIFKLNKEVIALKSCAKPSNSSDENGGINSSTPVSFSPIKATSNYLDSFSRESFPQFSPLQSIGEINQHSKASPTFSQDGLGDKSNATSDYLLSSMADSGNFDDLASSISLHSKDSGSLLISADVKHASQENISDGEDVLIEDDKVDAVQMLEKKLADKKLEYENKLKRVLDGQEEKNMRMLCEFENKLKEEEAKFESRWNALLKSVEEEKAVIVKRFEERLEEERQRYRENLSRFKGQTEGFPESGFEGDYSRSVENEKIVYETSLTDMRKRFESEKSAIEKKFDETMAAEKNKFEDNLESVKKSRDSQVADLSRRVSELESEYAKIIEKSRALERENESLNGKLKEQEENHRKMFLTIYNKGQEAARLELENEVAVPETASKTSSSKKTSVPQLFAQLKITEVELENLKDKEYREAHSDSEGGLCLLSSKEAISLWLLAARKAMYKRLSEAQEKNSCRKNRGESDAEATLQFLKSAVYYFLTDRENHVGHLKAIQSILGFSSSEKSNIENVYLSRY